MELAQVSRRRLYRRSGAFPSWLPSTCKQASVNQMIEENERCERHSLFSHQTFLKSISPFSPSLNSLPSLTEAAKTGERSSTNVWLKGRLTVLASPSSAPPSKTKIHLKRSRNKNVVHKIGEYFATLPLFTVLSCEIVPVRQFLLFKLLGHVWEYRPGFDHRRNVAAFWLERSRKGSGERADCRHV